MKAIEADWVWTGTELKSGEAVRVDDAGMVVEVGPAQVGDRRERHPGCLLMPGMVNAHSHAFQRAFRGHVQWRAAGQSDFWSWRDAMYRTAMGLSPEGVGSVSRLAFMEMAEAGITSVGEFHYLHHQADGTPYDDPDELAHRVISAALDVGIRIALLRVVYHRNGAGQALRPDQQRFRDDRPDDALAAVARLAAHPDPRVTAGLAPHSVRAVPADWMTELASFEGPIHAHVSEQPAENEQCLAEHGCSPLQVFEAGGVLSPRFSAVHLTFPLDGDVQRMVDHGSTVVVCPTTELDLGDGFLPANARAAALAVGSDSHARIDLFEEVRSVELHARALTGRRCVMAPEDSRHGLSERLLGIGTSGGARSVGVHSGLSAGSPADLCLVALEGPDTLGVPPLEAVVFGAGPAHVRQVWVGGDPLLEEGRHRYRDAFMCDARPHLIP